MKPPPFHYLAPESTDAALEQLAEHGPDAKLLAGGQSLVPMMNFRLLQPAVLIDLNRIDELAFVRAGDSGLRVGAMTRQSEVEHDAAVARECPLMRAALAHVAHPQIRNRGTVGGSLAHADPAAELPAVALALEARFRARSRERERWIDAVDFYRGLLTTSLEPDELLVEIEFPKPPPGTTVAFNEFARRHGDYALAGVAAVVRVDGDGTCGDVRLALFSVGDGPVLATEAAAALRGEPPDADALAAAAEIAATADIDPPADLNASVEYRRHLVRVLVRRTLEDALASPDGSAPTANPGVP